MNIRQQKIYIHTIPAIRWGASSKHVCFFIHGQFGTKEEASFYAELLCPLGWEVLSIDLPGHGERKRESDSFDPWHIQPELLSIQSYLQLHWTRWMLIANSIGAWFSLLSFHTLEFQHVFFISPIVDMNVLLTNGMKLANITVEQLEKERFITKDEQTFSIAYWNYVVTHPISYWPSCTSILYGEEDTIIQIDTLEKFADTHSCRLSCMAHGEHWFHTPSQLSFLKNWFYKELHNAHLL